MKRIYQLLASCSVVALLGRLANGQEAPVTFIPGQEGYPFSEGLAPLYDARYWKDAPNDSTYEIFGKYGFIDKKGRLIVPFLYEEAEGFNNGLAMVAARRARNQNHLLYGYINKVGEEVIPLQFEDAHPFSEGVAAVKQKGKWGFIDKTGKFLIGRMYKDAEPFSEGLAAVSHKSSEWKFIDIHNKTIIPAEFSLPYKFSDGLSASRGGAGESSTMINRKGEIGVTFENGVTPLGWFSEGLIKINGGYDEKLGQSLYGFGDKGGHIVIPPKFERAYGFHEGLAAVRKDEKYGFIDKSGRMKIPFRFTITEGEFLKAPPIFSEGLAFVKGGYIDKNGNWVLRTYEPSADDSD